MSLDPLITASDVAFRLTRDLTAQEAERLTFIIKDVSAAIRREARQQISRNTSTIKVTSRAGRLALPEHPVVSITSVIDYAGHAITYSWYAGWGEIVVDSSMLLNSWEVEPFSFSNPTLPATVTYVHGYNPVPDDILGVACSMAARALGATPTDAGVTSESLGSYSVTYGSAAAAGGFGMLDAERAIVRAYRRPRLPLPML